MSAATQRDMLQQAIGLKGQVGHGRLSWLASMPTTIAGMNVALDGTRGYDGIAVHAYGDYQLNDTSDWPAILRLALDQNRAVWITEAGINDHATMQATKAKRILAWMAANQNPRLVGLVVFGVTGTPNQWPQYMIDGGAADVYGARDTAVLDSAPPADSSHPAQPPGPPPFPTQPSRSIDVPNRGTFTVSGPFLERFNAYGGVLNFGYPMDNVQVEDGRHVQYFQAARFEWWPENKSPWDVQRTLYGQAAYTDRYGSKD